MFSKFGSLVARARARCEWRDLARTELVVLHALGASERASGGRVVDRVPDCEKKKTKKTKKTKETVSASLCVSGGRAGGRAGGVAGGAAIWRMKEF